MRTHAAGDTSPCCAVGCVASGPTTLTADLRTWMNQLSCS